MNSHTLRHPSLSNTLRSSETTHISIGGIALALGSSHFCDGECHGYLDYCGLPGSVPPRHRSVHNTACAKRLVYAFYICAALFLLTSFLFMPLRWLARRDPVCTGTGPCCSRFKRQRSATSGPGNSPDLNLVCPDVFPMGSMYSIRGVQYDPQQTQTTQILVESIEKIKRNVVVLVTPPPLVAAPPESTG
ncbi:unnamed protein product [Echinostoma caproni]|uniref:Uncharacterized protein n=1 Tax=Echinostoma caproni TaxID=27848 RepID=A0A183BDG4_9TREM|nr:unnamed protein product [Echinostoma caproni]